MVSPGYLADPDADAASFDDGWLRTGDVATVDSDGFVFIVDRQKDLIVSGGINIAPIEVEITPPQTIMRIEGGMITASTAETAVIAIENESP